MLLYLVGLAVISLSIFLFWCQFFWLYIVFGLLGLTRLATEKRSPTLCNDLIWADVIWIWYEPTWISIRTYAPNIQTMCNCQLIRCFFSLSVFILNLWNIAMNVRRLHHCTLQHKYISIYSQYYIQIYLSIWNVYTIGAIVIASLNAWIWYAIRYNWLFYTTHTHTTYWYTQMYQHRLDNGILLVWTTPWGWIFLSILFVTPAHRALFFTHTHIILYACCKFDSLSFSLLFISFTYHHCCRHPAYHCHHYDRQHGFPIHTYNAMYCIAILWMSISPNCCIVPFCTDVTISTMQHQTTPIFRYSVFVTCNAH